MTSKRDLWMALYLETYRLAYGALPICDCSHMSVVDFQAEIEEITGRLVMDHKYSQYEDESAYYNAFG